MINCVLGNARINFDERYILINQRSFSVEPKAMLLLRFMIENSGRVVTREKIKETIYPNHVVSYSAVNRLIADLRKVFNQDESMHDYILTVPKTGYKLNAEVQFPTEENEEVKLGGRGDTFFEKENDCEENYLELPYQNVQPLGCLESDVHKERYPRSWRLYLTSSFACIVLLISVILSNTEIKNSCHLLSNWLMAGSSSSNYQVCLISDVGVPAPSTHIIGSNNSKDEFIILGQNRWKEEYRLKKMKLTGLLKTSGLDGEVRMFLRTISDSNLSSLSFSEHNENEELIGEGQSWHERSVYLDVSVDVEGLVYGVYMKGNGDVWVDSFQLEVVEELTNNNKNNESGKSSKSVSKSVTQLSENPKHLQSAMWLLSAVIK